MLTLKKRPAKQESAKSPVKSALPEQRAEDRSAPDDAIRPLAYRKWQEAGCPACDGVEFWLVAEKEIRGGK